MAFCDKTHDQVHRKCLDLCGKLGVQEELKLETEHLLANGDEDSVKMAFRGLWEHCDLNKDGKVELDELERRLATGWSNHVATDHATQHALSQ